MDLVRDGFFFSLKHFFSQAMASSLSLDHSGGKQESNSALLVEGMQHCSVFTPVLVCPAHTSNLTDFNLLYKKEKDLAFYSYGINPFGKSQSQCHLAWLCWLAEVRLWLTGV